MHSRYYRLPKVLWDYIWTYDDRYKIEFKSCVRELNHYFNRNRIVDRIKADVQTYDVYLLVRAHCNIENNDCDRFYKYFFKKKQTFVDCLHPDVLKSNSLKPTNANNNDLVFS